MEKMEKKINTDNVQIFFAEREEGQDAVTLIMFVKILLPILGEIELQKRLLTVSRTVAFDEDKEKFQEQKLKTIKESLFWMNKTLDYIIENNKAIIQTIGEIELDPLRLSEIQVLKCDEEELQEIKEKSTFKLIQYEHD